jgi:hypothetical protein
MEQETVMYALIIALMALQVKSEAAPSPVSQRVKLMAPRMLGSLDGHVNPVIQREWKLPARKTYHV